MKKRQLAKLGVTLGLVGAVGVGGTLAILSQQSNQVTNTFTVGAGLQSTDITLDETDLKDKDLDSNMSDTNRTSTGNKYENLQPGMKLTKDPQVHLTAAAADSYVFANIQGLDEYLEEVNEGLTADTDKCTLMNGINSNWKAYDVENGKYDGVYVYVGATDSNRGIEATPNEGSKVSVGNIKFDSEKLFEGIQLTTKAALYETNGEGKTLPTIKVKALAVQATDTNTSWTDAKEVVNSFDWQMTE